MTAQPTTQPVTQPSVVAVAQEPVAAAVDIQSVPQPALEKLPA
jgi:hypothetical protein